MEKLSESILFDYSVRENKNARAMLHYGKFHFLECMAVSYEG